MTKLVPYIPWFLSVYTLVAMWMAARRPFVGWVLALGGQPLWAAYSWFSADGGGFLPLTVGLTIVYTLNIRRSLQHGRTRP